MASGVYWCALCGVHLERMFRGLDSYEREELAYELSNPYDPPYCSDCMYGMYDDLLALEEEIATEIASHPLNQLPSVVGIGRTACDKGSGTERFGRRRKDLWTPDRVRANESREHSRAKKPWRSEQRFVEGKKSRIDAWADLGIAPAWIRALYRVEDEPECWEDVVYSEWLAIERRHAIDVMLTEVEYLDDPMLYGDYLNPFADINVEETLRDERWHGHHADDCECYDCCLEAHKVDWIEYDMDHWPYDDEYDAECQAVMDIDHDDSPFDDRR